MKKMKITTNNKQIQKVGVKHESFSIFILFVSLSGLQIVCHHRDRKVLPGQTNQASITAHFPGNVCIRQQSMGQRMMVFKAQGSSLVYMFYVQKQRHAGTQMCAKPPVLFYLFFFYCKV